VKIRMLVGMSGTRGGQEWPPQCGVLEVGDEEGAQLCGAGLAEPVADRDKKTEKAVKPPAEERTGGLTTDTVPTRTSRARRG
jgi:hypothetical protein